LPGGYAIARIPLTGHPAISMGNTVVAIPSEKYPLITGDLYQVFETSDLPGGVVNIVTGRMPELTKTLAEHDDMDAVWCLPMSQRRNREGIVSGKSEADVYERRPRHRLVRYQQGEGRWFLEHAVQVKNIWVPYGE